MFEIFVEKEEIIQLPISPFALIGSLYWMWTLPHTSFELFTKLQKLGFVKKPKGFADEISSSNCKPWDCLAIGYVNLDPHHMIKNIKKGKKPFENRRGAIYNNQNFFSFSWIVFSLFLNVQPSNLIKIAFIICNNFQFQPAIFFPSNIKT